MLASGFLVLLEKILKFVVALVLAVAKIIRAVALVFVSIFLALFLLALTFFFVSRGLDLRNSESFRDLRDRTFEICGEWFEPEFAASEARAVAWGEYREVVKAAYRAEVSSEEKIQMVQDARSELRSVLQENDADIFSWVR